MPSEEVAMEHQFFIRQQNLKLYRSLLVASEAAAAKADRAAGEAFKATGRGSSERTATQKELRRLLKRLTVSTIRRISFVCAQARIEAE